MIVVVFRLRPNLAELEEMTAVNDKMVELVEALPGFVSYKDFVSDDGEYVTIAEFADAASLQAWREHPLHRAAIKAGYERWYPVYDISVCTVDRRYSRDTRARAVAAGAPVPGSVPRWTDDAEDAVGPPAPRSQPCPIPASIERLLRRRVTMITFYGHRGPNPHKIAIALEELQLPYRVVVVDTGKHGNLEPDFMAISPSGKVPLITDDETGLTIYESNAILLYLADKTPKTFPVRGRGAMGSSAAAVSASVVDRSDVRSAGDVLAVHAREASRRRRALRQGR